MSLNISAYGSAIANQLLSYLLSRPSSSQTTPANSNASAASSAPSPANSASNTMTGTSKPSLSNDVLSTIMNLQQSSNVTTSASFREPAVRLPDSDQQPAPTLSPAHNNMMRAVRSVADSSAPAATALQTAVPEISVAPQIGADANSMDDADTSDATIGNIAATSSFRL